MRRLDLRLRRDGFDYETMMIEDDVAAQAEQTFSNIEARLVTSVRREEYASLWPGEDVNGSSAVQFRVNAGGQ